jgi:hypothetical protein
LRTLGEVQRQRCLDHALPPGDVNRFSSKIVVITAPTRANIPDRDSCERSDFCSAKCPSSTVTPRAMLALDSETASHIHDSVGIRGLEHLPLAKRTRHAKVLDQVHSLRQMNESTMDSDRRGRGRPWVGFARRTALTDGRAVHQPGWNFGGPRCGGRWTREPPRCSTPSVLWWRSPVDFRLVDVATATRQ